MEYREAYGYMMNAARTGIRPGLTRIRELMGILGDPQDKLYIIHVAGTNGKGSVCAFLEYILRDAGVSVCRYISPSLFDYRERFQLDGRYITEEEFVRIVEEVKAAADRMDDRPTAFELETAVAFLFAKYSSCGALVLETGMGGLYDATNVIKKPLCTVFVSIGMDHMQYLGNDIRSIASEKAGILKDGVPAVSARQQDDVTEILQKAAAGKAAELRTVDPGELSGITGFDEESWTQSFFYRGEEYRTGLIGTYQLMNAAVAIETAMLLNEKGYFAIDRDNIRRGLENARWPGRFDRMALKPMVIADGAHNPHGAAELRKTLSELLPDKRIIPVMGAFKDKDTEGILREMSGVSESITVYSAPGERGLPAKELKEQAAGYFDKVTACRDVREAMDTALADAAFDDDAAVLVFGTLSTVKDVSDFLKEKGLTDIIRLNG